MQPCTSNHQHSSSNDSHVGGTPCDCNKCQTPQLPRYYENNPPKYCPDYCDGLPGGAKEIFAKYGSAVVAIHSQWYFTENAVQPTPGPDTVQNLELHGNGFFTHTKHAIIVPAHLVLAPPNASLGLNQFNFATDSITSDNGAGKKYYNKDAIYPANRILVDVYDVNGSGHSYTYEAKILAFSGIADLAIIYIDAKSTWNSRLPCIKDAHPHFRFGCSRKARPGDVVFAIGDGQGRSIPELNNFNRYNNRTRSHQVYKGTIGNPRHIDHAGYAQAELVTSDDLPIFDRAAGLPLIDKFGYVIGLQTLTVSGGPYGTNNKAGLVENTSDYNAPLADGFVGGPSQFFLIHIIKKLLEPGRPCNRDYVELIQTASHGDIWRYKQGFLGLAWEKFDGHMYQSHRDVNGWEVATLNASSVNPNENPLVLKEVIGLRVVGIAMDVDGVKADPGAVPPVVAVDPAVSTTQADLYLPQGGSPSPLNNPLLLEKDKIYRNDIIAFADACPLGDLKATSYTSVCSAGQIPISLVLFRKAAGEPVVLSVRSFDSTTGYLTPIFSKAYLTKKAPLFWDYPWYKYHKFPFKLTTAFQDNFDDTFPYLSDLGTVAYPVVLGGASSGQNILTTPVV